MNSLSEAFAEVGLTSRAEIEIERRAEREALQRKFVDMRPKTIEDYFSAPQGWRFFDRVYGITIFVEEDPALIDTAIAAAKKHLAGGNAGRAFISQLEQVKAGTLTIAGLKAKWKTLFEG